MKKLLKSLTWGIKVKTFRLMQTSKSLISSILMTNKTSITQAQKHLFSANKTQKSREVLLLFKKRKLQKFHRKL